MSHEHDDHDHGAGEHEQGRAAHLHQCGGLFGCGDEQGTGIVREDTVESTKETVQLGVFDETLAPILTVESGDIISYPNTWSHFLNEMQPGVAVDTLAQLRKDNPGKGPHSIIGPVAVKDAQPGD